MRFTRRLSSRSTEALSRIEALAPAAMSLRTGINEFFLNAVTSRGFGTTFCNTPKARRPMHTRASPVKSEFL
jgi:hypothetical protein